MSLAMCPECGQDFYPDDYYECTEGDWLDWECPKCGKHIELSWESDVNFNTRIVPTLQRTPQPEPDRQ